MGFGENGKRYQLHQPASMAKPCWRVLILTIKHSASTSALASDDNNGATLMRAGMVRIRSFPSNLQFGEADGDAPV